MEAIDKLRDQFIKETAKRGPMPLYDAEVTAVDSDTYTCTVMLEGVIEIPNVRLRAVVSDKKSIDIMPAVSAQVVVGKMADDDYIVIACDQITNYRIAIGNMVFTIGDGGFSISNGADSLKNIMTDLVNGILTIYAPKDVAGITALLERINALLQ